MNSSKHIKTIEELYPDLSWDKSFDGIIGLTEAEDRCSEYFIKEYSHYIKVWEYGYYFISLLINKASVERSYSPLVALYVEAHSSLRCSFLCNLKGYHPEAISLLRRVHECCTKLMAGRAFPQKIWDIVQCSSLWKADSDLGIDLRWIYRLESSYLHSNKLKVIGIGKKLKNKEEIGIPCGPQMNDNEIQIAANLSIFWIYILILIAPRLFTDQIPDFWLNKYSQSYKLFKDHLKCLPKKNALALEAEQIENILDKIGPETFGISRK
jgi:hypothetical protein